MQPLVTVLLPVYNCEKYIKECIDSILTQTYSNFEFLIIDDCSTDNTVNIIKQYQDERIKLTVKEKNTGYTDSLNWGIKNANGEYIARMDGDDICMPTRFEKQVEVLNSNQQIVVCGTSINIIDSSQTIIIPEFNEDIIVRMLYENCIAHPTVMIRKTCLLENNIFYDGNFEPAEDYNLWIRLIKYGELYNIQEKLLKYRIHNESVTRTRAKKQNESALESKILLINYLNYNFTVNETVILKKIFTNESIFDFKQLINFLDIINKLAELNSRNIFKKNNFNLFLKTKQNLILSKYFTNREFYFPLLIVQYLKLRKKVNLNLLKIVKLFIKCIIFHKTIKTKT